MHGDWSRARYPGNRSPERCASGGRRDEATRALAKNRSTGVGTITKRWRCLEIAAPVKLKDLSGMLPIEAFTRIVLAESLYSAPAAGFR